MQISDVAYRLNKIYSEYKNRKDYFTIAFCGVFSSGKSSILNYFLNYKEDLLPIGINPVTKIVTKIKYGLQLRYYLLADGFSYPIDQFEFRELVLGNKNLPTNCKEITIEVPSEILKNGIVFLDTPGFEDEMGGELEQMSREAVLKSDLAIFCTNACKLGSQFEKEYLEELEESVGNFCMLVNHIDRLNTESDRNDIYKRAAFLMGMKGGKILNNLFGKNHFFTIAAGSQKTLQGFDKYLNYALGDEYLRTQLKKSSSEKIIAYQKRKLAEEIQLEIQPLKADLEKAEICHKKKKLELINENNIISINNEQERTRLNSLFKIKFENTMDFISKQIEVLIEPASFAKEASRIIRSNCLAMFQELNQQIKVDDEAQERIVFEKMMDFEIETPQLLVIKRNSTVERVLNSAFNIIGDLFTDLNVQYSDIVPEFEYGYGDYQASAIEYVKNTIQPKLLCYIKSRIERYNLKDPIMEITGYEEYIENKKTILSEWNKILDCCNE